MSLVGRVYDVRQYDHVYNNWRTKLLLVVAEDTFDGKPVIITLNLQTGEIMDHWEYLTDDWERRGWRFA